jgi:hypothetical protein
MAILHHKRALARRIAVGDDRVLHLPVGAMIRAAVAAKTNRSRTPKRLSLYDTFLEGLAQDLQSVAALRPCIQQEPPVVRPRHLAGPRLPGPRRSTPQPRWCGAGRVRGTPRGTWSDPFRPGLGLTSPVSVGFPVGVSGAVPTVTDRDAPVAVPHVLTPLCEVRRGTTSRRARLLGRRHRGASEPAPPGRQAHGPPLPSGWRDRVSSTRQ